MKKLFILLVLFGAAFAYTSGNGSIQSCYLNNYDYCTVTSNSTINSDFSITNRQTVINDGVIITILGGKLSINSSELIWLKSGAKINADGASLEGFKTGGSGSAALSRNPGTGAGAATGGENGGNGTTDNSAPCSVLPGYGSGLAPFEFAYGNAGTASGSSRYANGGEFYAGGGAFGNGISFSCAGGHAGGSGHAIKLRSATIQIDGNITLGGGDGIVGDSSHANGGAGGGGAGEFIAYGAYIDNSGRITANGGAGHVICPVSSCAGNGGDGGRMKFCSKVANTTGTTSLTGGACSAVNGGSCTAGSDGLYAYDHLSSCFDNLVLNMYQANSSFNTSEQNITFKLGVFNTANVSCNYTLDSVVHSMGVYNFSNVTEYNLTLNTTNGNHTVSITCANSSAGITALSSETFSFSVSGLAGGGCTLDSDCSTGYICSAGACVLSGGGGSSGGGSTGGSTGTPSTSTVPQSPPGGDDQPETTPPPAEEQTYPDPNENPDFYTDPTDTTGQSTIADKIVEITKGELGQLPYTCSPTFNNWLPFIGSEFADRFVCENKGLLSLYWKRTSTFGNVALIALILFAILLQQNEEKAKTNTNLQTLQNIWWFGLIAVFVIGFDFLAFNLTALLIYSQLYLSGKALI